MTAVLGLPWSVPFWGMTLIKVGVILVVVPTSALVLGYVFLMKMMSHMQSRLGPMEAGPHGTLQLVADGVKFIQKEDIMPARADKRVFALAPLVVLLSTFLLYVVVPAGPRLIVEDLDTGIFFALAVSSISVIGVLMAGWASANKYSLLGALRAAGQLIAYELPLVLAVMGVVVLAGSMSMQTIVRTQAGWEWFGWSTFNLLGHHVHVGVPFIVPQFLGFVLFMIAAQAELTQPPFDMPVAESEIVAGYMTEYTGFRFLLFFLSEFATAFALAGIAATLFLGGWYVPGVHGNAANFVGPVVMVTKIMIVAFFIFWIRFTYPRFREDQLQAIAWKYLIPLALVNIVATGILKVVF